jgi:hypothetical protein
MTGLKLIPLTFSFEIVPWGQLHYVLLYIWMVQTYVMVLDDKMAVGHQKKDRNTNCICLVLNVPKHTHHQNILQGGKYGCPLFFLKHRNLETHIAFVWF